MATKEGIALIMKDLKREEIREGIGKWIPCPMQMGDEWESCPDHKYAEGCAYCVPKMRVVAGLTNYLHSQNVVIKVDRELPELPYCYHHPDTINLNCFTCGDIVGQRNQRSNIVKAGWEATEPLI